MAPVKDQEECPFKSDVWIKNRSKCKLELGLLSTYVPKKKKKKERKKKAGYYRYIQSIPGPNNKIITKHGMNKNRPPAIVCKKARYNIRRRRRRRNGSMEMKGEKPFMS